MNLDYRLIIPHIGEILIEYRSDNPAVLPGLTRIADGEWYGYGHKIRVLFTVQRILLREEKADENSVKLAQLEQRVGYIAGAPTPVRREPEALEYVSGDR